LVGNDPLFLGMMMTASKSMVEQEEPMVQCQLVIKLW
jgi:hypothetical protein